MWTRVHDRLLERLGIELLTDLEQRRRVLPAPERNIPQLQPIPLDGPLALEFVAIGTASMATMSSFRITGRTLVSLTVSKWVLLGTRPAFWASGTCSLCEREPEPRR